MNPNPMLLERGQKLVVSDNESRYDGVTGFVFQIYEDRIVLELEPNDTGASLVKTFDLEQLSHP